MKKSKTYGFLCITCFVMSIFFLLVATSNLVDIYNVKDVNEDITELISLMQEEEQTNEIIDLQVSYLNLGSSLVSMTLIKFTSAIIYAMFFFVIGAYTQNLRNYYRRIENVERSKKHR